ncbi:MAG: HEAT repeat domain-containing protein [Armatimonadota bacterium]
MRILPRFKYGVVAVVALMLAIGLSPARAENKVDIPALIQQLLVGDMMTSMGAADILAAQTDPAVMKQLVDICKKGDDREKNAVLRVFRIVGVPAAKELIASFEKGDVNWRCKAIEILRSILYEYRAQHDELAFVPEALQPYAIDRDAHVRAAVASCLGRIRNDIGVGMLLKAAKDPATEVRQAALFPLCEYRENTQTRALLIDLLLHDTEAEIRRSAAFSLGNLCDPKTLDVYLAAAKDQDAGVRRAAIYCMGQTKNMDALPYLKAALKETDAAMRASAIHGFASLCPKEVLTEITPLLKDTDTSVRDAAFSTICWSIRTENQLASHPETVEILLNPDFLRDRGDSFDLADSIANLGELTLPKITVLLNDNDAKIRCIAARTLSSMVTGRQVRPLAQLITAMQDPDKDVRGAAAPGTAYLLDAKLLNTLVKGMDDSYYYVKQYMFDGLARLQDARAVQPLLVKLTNKNVDDIVAAARALGAIGDPCAGNELAGLLLSDNAAICRQAMNSLAAIGDQRGLSPLLTQLRATDPAERANAASALRAYHTEQVVAALQNTLRNDVAPMARGNAAASLGTIGDMHAVDALLAAVKDPVPAVRGEVVNALGSLKDKRAVDTLLGLLDDTSPIDGWTSVRRRATNALGSFPEERVVQRLITMCHSTKSGDEFSTTCQALGRIGALAVPALLAEIDRTDTTVGNNVISALCKIKDPRAVDPLLAAAANRANDDSLLEGFTNNPDPRAIPYLKKVLADPQGYYYMALKALGAIKDPQTIDAILPFLQHKDNEYREVAVAALGNIGDARVFPQVLALLNDPFPDVRCATIEALGKFGKQEAVMPLITAVNVEEDNHIRAAIATAFKQLNDQRAILPLIVLLHDENRGPRAQAADALQAITGQKFGQDAAAWEKWWVARSVKAQHR